MSRVQERSAEGGLSVAKQRRYAMRRDADPLRYSRRQDELSRKSRNQRTMDMTPQYRDLSPTEARYLGHVHAIRRVA